MKKGMIRAVIALMLVLAMSIGMLASAEYDGGTWDGRVHYYLLGSSGSQSGGTVYNEYDTAVTYSPYSSNLGTAKIDFYQLNSSGGQLKKDTGSHFWQGGTETLKISVSFSTKGNKYWYHISELKNAYVTEQENGTANFQIGKKYTNLTESYIKFKSYDTAISIPEAAHIVTTQVSSRSSLNTATRNVVIRLNGAQVGSKSVLFPNRGDASSGILVYPANSARYYYPGSYTWSDPTYYVDFYDCKYTLNYYANGAVFKTQTAGPHGYATNTFSCISDKPTREGYHFVGWADSDGASSAQYTSGSGIVGNRVTSTNGSSGVSTKNVYAVWVPANFYVAFNGNGATSGSMAKQTFKWNVAQALTANAFKREYTVTYSGNGGTSAKTSETAAATFNGWEDRNDIIYNGTTYLWSTFDAPYYANAYGDLYNAFGYNKYSLVSHFANNGIGEGRTGKGSSAGLYPNQATVANLTSIDEGTVELIANWSLKNVTLPTATRAGYTLDGWYNGSTRVGAANAVYTPTSNVTLIAKWNANIYKVTLDNQSATAAGTAAYWYKYQTTSTVDGETIYYWTDAACTSPLRSYRITTPTKTGYTFGGYYTATNGGGTQYVDANGYCINNLYNARAADTTLYAMWTPINYNITYNLDGGSVSGNPTSYNPETATFTLKNPTKSGYDFLGWTGSNGSTPQTTVEIAKGTTGDKSYTANWKKIVFTVRWVDYDGTLLKTDTVNYGDMPSYGATPTRESSAEFHYAFKAWSPSIVATTDDATYTATYTETKREYPITFKNEDGTVLTMSNFQYGVTPNYSGTTPQKEQTESEVFTFAGWHIELSPVTGEAEYVATYESAPRKYTVIWKNGGSVLATEEYEYDTMPAYKGETPQKAKDTQNRYEFAGWAPTIAKVTEDATYEATFDAIELPPVADLVIETSGCKETQSFVFKVTSLDDRNFAPVEVPIIGNNRVVIKDIPTGRYNIEEEDSWTWRYDEVEDKQITVIAGNENTVTFESIKIPRIARWFSGLASLFN